MMGAVTYPDNMVSGFLDRHFCCFKLNVKEKGNPDLSLLKDYRLLWEPGFVFLDHRGTEIRRQVGYLPPEEFVAEALVALGKIDLMYGREEEARRRFGEAESRSGPHGVAPEAVYWAGIADLRISGGDKDALRESWEALRSCYPNSIWWKKADVF